MGATGCQKLIEEDDERKLRIFYDKRIATEVAADELGDEWKGYRLRITGGNDKQGFPMKQGVLTHTRVRLLLSKGHSCYRPLAAVSARGSLSVDASLMDSSAYSTWLSSRRVRRISPVLPTTPFLVVLGPSVPARSVVCLT